VTTATERDVDVTSSPVAAVGATGRPATLSVRLSDTILRPIDFWPPCRSVATTGGLLSVRCHIFAELTRQRGPDLGVRRRPPPG